MAKFNRIQRRNLLRQAEGYLELILLFDDQWPLEQDQVQLLADRSLECLDQLETRFGSSARLLYLKGQVYRILGRFAQAIFYLTESSRVDESNVETYLALGWCYKRTGRLDLAVAALESALDIDFGQAITHYNLACYWALAGQAQLAIKHLGIAFDIDSDYRALVYDEPDFDLIRQHPAFQTLTTVIV